MKLFFCYNFFCLDKKNYIFGIFSSMIEVYEEEPRIFIFSKQDNELSSKELNLYVGSRSFDKYVIFLVFSMENLNFLDCIVINFMREIKMFLNFYKNKDFSNNSEEFNVFLKKISIRIEHYLEIIYMIEDKPPITIYFLFKFLKLCLPKHLPFFQLPESLNNEFKHVFYKIYESVSEDIKLFSDSKICILPLGFIFSFKGLLLLTSLENELAYYLSSLSELYSISQYFSFILFMKFMKS